MYETLNSDATDVGELLRVLELFRVREKLLRRLY